MVINIQHETIPVGTVFVICSINKRHVADFRHTVRDLYARQRGAFVKCPVADRRHAVRDNNARQFNPGRAYFQSRAVLCVQDPVDGFVIRIVQINVYARQRGAVVKRIVSDRRHAVRDSHARQRGAVFKCPVADRRHAVRDSHGFDGCVVKNAEKFIVVISIVFPSRQFRYTIPVDLARYSNVRRRAVIAVDSGCRAVVVDCVLPISARSRRRGDGDERGQDHQRREDECECSFLH